MLVALTTQLQVSALQPPRARGQRTSRSGGGWRLLPTCQAAPSGSVKVKVTVPLKVAFGQQVAVIGSTPALGSWHPEKAVKLDWSESHEWTGEVEIPVGEPVSFKLILTSDGGGVEWQPGADRTLVLPEEAAAPAASVTVVDEWKGEKPLVTVDTPAPPAPASTNGASPPAVEGVEAETKEKELTPKAAAPAAAPAPPAEAPAPAKTAAAAAKLAPAPAAPKPASPNGTASPPLAAAVTTRAAAPAAAAPSLTPEATVETPVLAGKAAAEDEYLDLEDLTITQLKDRLKGLGLSTEGRKVELIERLKDGLGLAD